MKFKLIVDEHAEESLTIVCNKKREVFDQIEQLINNFDSKLIGYENDEIVIIKLEEVNCFISENNKVYALVNNHKYLIKKRLYQVEELLDLSYIRINQSCIANISKIIKFNVTFNGFLKVVFENKYEDYISRRELKNVKERLGI